MKSRQGILEGPYMLKKFLDKKEHTKRFTALFTLILCLLTACGKQTMNAQQDSSTVIGANDKKKDHSKCTLDSFEQPENGKGQVVFEGKKHGYILHLPECEDNAPLVVMLHGYGESAESFCQKTNFEREANAKGYAVVYITGLPTPEDPTSAAGWNSGIGISSNNDVDFLCAFVNDLCKIYSFDRTRIYAVGFSNGAFMTHRLAIEANDIFAAIVSVAGMMPAKMWEDKPEKCEIGVFQITGEKDDVVPKDYDGSSKYSKAPAIETVIEYYVKINGLSHEDRSVVGKKSTLEKYSSLNSTKQVWSLFIPDGRHSWPDEQIVGFNVNNLIIDFLETQ